MHKVFKMLLQEDKINESVIENLMSWHNSGFNVHFSDILYPQDLKNREKAARYLVRAPISLSKMTYDWNEGKVIYGNPGGEKRVYEALDFLALVSSHRPDKFENRILYYGFCLPPDLSHRGGRRNPGGCGKRWRKSSLVWT